MSRVQRGGVDPRPQIYISPLVSHVQDSLQNAYWGLGGLVSGFTIGFTMGVIRFSTSVI